MKRNTGSKPTAYDKAQIYTLLIGTLGIGSNPITTPLPTTPATPQQLTATALSTLSIYLEWSSTGENTVNYEVERSEDDVTYALIATVPVGVTVYTDVDLTAATLYYYRVRATNLNAQSPYSNVASATTDAEIVTLGVSEYSESGGLTVDGLNWSWAWSSGGAGVGVWAITGIPTGELGKMDMSFSIDSRGDAPTGPNWSYGAFIVESEGDADSVSPNVMGAYYVSGTLTTLGVRNVINGVSPYALSSTMYFVLKIYRTAPVLAGSYATGHLISFTLKNGDGDTIAEYP